MKIQTVGGLIEISKNNPGYVAADISFEFRKGICMVVWRLKVFPNYWRMIFGSIVFSLFFSETKLHVVLTRILPSKSVNKCGSGADSKQKMNAYPSTKACVSGMKVVKVIQFLFEDSRNI